MQPRARNNNKGSVVLESILVLPLSALLLAFFLEVARRPLYEMAAQWASFSLARQALLKGNARASAETRVWLRSALRGLPVRQKKAVVERMTDSSWESQVFIRFPALQRDVRKHFQLSRRCRFSFPY
jgi:hypothetical protein